MLEINRSEGRIVGHKDPTLCSEKARGNFSPFFMPQSHMLSPGLPSTGPEPGLGRCGSHTELGDLGGMAMLLLSPGHVISFSLAQSGRGRKIKGRANGGDLQSSFPSQEWLLCCLGALGVATITCVHSSRLHADSWAIMTISRLRPRASGSSIWVIHQMTGKQQSSLNQERPKLVVRKAPWRYEHVLGLVGGGEGVCGVA